MFIDSLLTCANAPPTIARCGAPSTRLGGGSEGERLLHEVQDCTAHRKWQDGHHEERASSHPGQLPEVRHSHVQAWEGLGAAQTRCFVSYFPHLRGAIRMAAALVCPREAIISQARRRHLLGSETYPIHSL
jgi:hypothetical protein